MALGNLRLRTESRWLVIILALSVLARLVAAICLGHVVDVQPSTHDLASYDAPARGLAPGKGIALVQGWSLSTKAHTTAAHWSFLSVRHMAAAYALADHHPLVPRLVQAVIAGLLTSWLVCRLGRRAPRRSAGEAGTAAVAGHIHLVWNASSLMTEPLHIHAAVAAGHAPEHRPRSARAARWWWPSGGLGRTRAALPCFLTGTTTVRGHPSRMTCAYRYYVILSAGRASAAAWACPDIPRTGTHIGR